MPARKSRSITSWRDVGIGLEHAEVHVAVAGVAAPGDPRAGVGGESPAPRAMNSGIAARGTTTSTMSLAPLALASQNAFSRASMSCGGRARRQHVDVEGAELGEQLGQRCDVGVEAVLVRVLQHHDQVGQGRVLDLLGDAELELVGAGHGRHGEQVDVLEDLRAEPESTMRGTAPVTSSSVGERGQHGGARGRGAGAA